MFSAVVLAGGGKQEPLTEQEGVTNKAFINLEGQALLSYTLKALEEASHISEIVVVGPSKELKELQGRGYKFIIAAERESMLDNLASGFEQVDSDRLCFVATGDIPLVNGEIIDSFIDLCSPHDSDFYYPVLNKEDFMLKFPETERTYVRLKEGFITGGNIALLNPGWFLNNKKNLELFISYRKKPLKLMRLMPISFIPKYLLKTLSIDDLVRHLSALLQLKARAVKFERIEIGIDVDKLSDLSLVRDVFRKNI